jgi:dinuclear metal center YbgI/SA1388 family protein
MKIQDACQFLEQFAPLMLAESWDNTGLLVGRPDAPLRAVMTCLTITPESAAEALEQKADLIVTHHPLPFHPLKRITATTPTGRLLLDLIEAHIAVYSPHTAFDSSAGGINQALAEMLQLENIVPLTPLGEATDPWGAGRCGQLPVPQSLSEIAVHMKQRLEIPYLQLVGHPDHLVQNVGVGCGSAGGFLQHARTAGCELFVTGEATFHRALEAKAEGIGMLLLGHYFSERFAVERLAGELAEQFPALRIWASQKERDPYHWI